MVDELLESLQADIIYIAPTQNKEAKFANQISMFSFISK